AMDLFSNLALGFSIALTPFNLAMALAGVFLGTLIGALPGVGPVSGIALLLPLTFGMPPTSGIIMLAALYAGSMYGGTITSVLINTPGESASVATTFDGYPMAQQGRAGPALVLAAVASFVAGTIGAIFISIFAPVVATMASNFGPPELFLVVVAGLLTLVVIIGRNRLLGAISALVGFAMATVGLDITTGEQRYTFGSPDLIEGIDFVPVAIGIFGVGEILWSLYNRAHHEDLKYVHVSYRNRDFWPTRRDWAESRGSMGRGSLLGFVVGSIPGAGATVASLMSYSTEKAVSKEPQKFGRGAVPGLVGPEAANNAASAGSMVPLLTLGIPGSAATAVLLGGFLIWGLTPGPLLMEQEPEFAWGLIGSMYLGNVMLLVINIFCVPAFAQVARVPFRILGPIVILLCVIGAYAVNESVLEVGVMLACGVLGFFMRRFGFSPAALVIALVLGPLAEESLRQTLLISSGSFAIFVERGASLMLLTFIAVLCVLAFVGPRAFRVARQRLEQRADSRRAEADQGDTDAEGPSEEPPKDDQRRVDV
ncbi:MAG: tripartite tricarboxylate transporter permease, partial [Nocardioidaceae bacterium]